MRGFRAWSAIRDKHLAAAKEAYRVDSDAEDVVTPFTAAQVVVLNRFQQGGWCHPFTCGRHTGQGVLIATEEGWHCPVEDCDYVQNWAHWWMADPDMVAAGERRRWS